MPAPVAWVMPADLAGPTIGVGSVLGRSFDTFGREWSLFLVLAAPAGLGALFQSLLTAPAPTSTAARLNLNDVPPALAAALLTALLALVSTVSIAVAADALWQGRPIGVMGAFREGLRALPRYLGVSILIGLMVGGLVLTAALLMTIAVAVIGPVAIVIAVLGLVIGVPIAAYVAIRLSLLLPVIALERHGVVGSIVRAWELSRGRALVLFLLAMTVGISAALPLWGGSMFAGFSSDPVIAGVALGIATLVYEPLPAIAMVLAWGDLVGDRHRDSDLMARGRGRRIAVVLVFGIGAILLVAGLGVAAQALPTAAGLR